MRHTSLYNELIEEFNFSDSSVGIYPISFEDEGEIIEILNSFNLIPIGYSQTSNSRGYDFKYNNSTYTLKYENGKFKIYETIIF